MKLSALIVAALLAVGATTVSASTLGENLATGQISEQAMIQLIAGTGLTLEEARTMTVEEVVSIKWQDD